MKLEKPVVLTGKVLHGAALGRKMNMPTINIVPAEDVSQLAFGVYFSKVTVDGQTFKGITNVGVKPTVQDSQNVNVETYLYDFDADVYNKDIVVELTGFRRPERKFASLEDLQKQLQEDFEAGKKHVEQEKNMEKSKVYFTDFRTANGVGLPEKLSRLCKKAGLPTMDLNNKFVAVKMHFGELGNVAYIRPNYAKAVCDLIKACGGRPFLTDCNTLYPGSRKNALDHLDCAQENGFNEITTGCHVIIGDGLKGTDDVAVPVVGGEYCTEAYIGRAVMDADVFISLNHFKGHEATGFGGALKNIGMGCGSRAGKMHQHNQGKPIVNENNCVNCRRCAKECGSDAIHYETGRAVINPDECKGCGRCIGACNFDAIHNPNDNTNEVLGCKIAEYSKAVLDGRQNFHISLVMDISPNCDCHSENDAPILPDIGMYASFDPVALDQACADACLAAEPIRNSQLGDNLAKTGWFRYHDNFLDSNPNVRWKETLEHAEKIGIGTRNYELIKM